MTREHLLVVFRLLVPVVGSNAVTTNDPTIIGFALSSFLLLLLLLTKAREIDETYSILRYVTNITTMASTKITQIDNKSCTVAWSPHKSHADVIALGTKVR